VLQKVFGSQEGATKGYNSKKKGKRGILPFFALLLKTVSVSITGFGQASPFMNECFDKIPKRVWKIFVGADSTFF